MKKIIVKFFLCFLMFCFSLSNNWGQPSQEGSQVQQSSPDPQQQNPCTNYKPDELIIEIDKSLPAPGEITGTMAFTLFGGIAVDSIISNNYSIYLVKFNFPNPYFNSLEDALEFYSCGGGEIVIGANLQKIKSKKSDLNYIFSSNPQGSGSYFYTPSNYEPYPECQEPYIGLPDILTPCEDIVIAIVDSGHQLGTPFDDQVLMSKGYNFVDDTPIITAGSPHGTMVTGVIAGETYSNRDNISFVPVQVIGEDGEGTAFAFYEGLDYAIENTQISNVSVELVLCEMNQCNSIFETLLEKAEDENHLIIAAAGNSTLTIDPGAYYVIPGSSMAENLIVVGGSECLLTPAPFSNKSSINVDLLAPAIDILVYPGTLTSGTSFAAPQITSVSAIKALTQSGFSAAEIKNFVLENTINQGWDEQCLTGGSFDYQSNFGECPNNFNSNEKEYGTTYTLAKELNSVDAFFSNNGFSLHVNSSLNQQSKIQLINLSGMVVFEKTASLNQGANKLFFNLDQSDRLPLGIYFLSISLENGDLLAKKVFKST